MSIRYHRVTVLFHWGLGLALVAQLCFGVSLDDIAPRGTPARAAVINLHKSYGIVLLALIVARLAWRLTHAAPPWPLALPAWQRRAAAWTHRALYACMLVSPLSGWTASNFSSHGVKFFGVALPPLGPDRPDVYAAFNTLHVACGWIFIALLVLHVAAALKHQWLDRDDLLSRMSWRRPAPERPATGLQAAKESR